MRMLPRSFAAAVVLLVAATPVLSAQTPAPAPPSAQTPAQPPASRPAAAGIRQELVQQLEDAERKYVALAQAIPQEKYGWRPAQGVRSVSEVFVHVAGANFMIPGMAGVQRAPAVTLARDAETTITDRTRIVELLQQSFAHAKQAVMDVPEGELDANVTLFGRPSTKRGVFLLIATHAHEHLGQSIAYARMNGVTPPWSGGGGGN